MSLFNETWIVVDRAEDVTDEILDAAEDIVDGWFADGPIDWENVWDRLEGMGIADGARLDLGRENDTPAMRKIQRVIRERHREG